MAIDPTRAPSPQPAGRSCPASPARQKSLGELSLLLEFAEDNIDLRTMEKIGDKALQFLGQ